VRLVLLAALLLAPGRSGAQTLFRFPAPDPDGQAFLPLVIHVDDSQPPSSEYLVCTNYADEPFPFCYGGHDGTDFLLVDGFTAMDRGVPALAAADGVVVEVVDGNYDRCHTGPPDYDVSCDGHPMIANRVLLRHADGLQSGYWHLRNGSILVKVGDTVRCGQQLALVGSSGHSAAPHIHFQVNSADGALIDPFAGPRSQARSYWVDQVGAFRHPGERCAGDPLPADAAIARPDGGPTTPASADATPAPASPLGSTAAAGCTLAPAAVTAAPGWLLALLLLALIRVARRNISGPP
jgi:hypothetical protein